MIYVTINYASNKLIYDFKVNNIFSLFVDLSSENYSQLRQFKRKDAETIIIFVVVFSKSRYNAIHKTIDIKIENKIYFRLHQNYIILNLTNHKFSNQRMKPFSILKKIDNLIFRL